MFSSFSALKTDGKIIIVNRKLTSEQKQTIQMKKDQAILRAASNFTGEVMNIICTEQELTGCSITGQPSPFQVPTAGSEKAQLNPELVNGISSFVMEEFAAHPSMKKKIVSFMRAKLNNASAAAKKNSHESVAKKSGKTRNFKRINDGQEKVPSADDDALDEANLEEDMAKEKNHKTVVQKEAKKGNGKGKRRKNDGQEKPPPADDSEEEPNRILRSRKK